MKKVYSFDPAQDGNDRLCFVAITFTLEVPHTEENVSEINSLFFAFLDFCKLTGVPNYLQHISLRSSAHMSGFMLLQLSSHFNGLTLQYAEAYTKAVVSSFAEGLDGVRMSNGAVLIGRNPGQRDLLIAALPKHNVAEFAARWRSHSEGRDSDCAQEKENLN